MVGFKQTHEGFDFAAGGLRKDYVVYALQLFEFDYHAWHIDCYSVNDSQLSCVLCFY